MGHYKENEEKKSKTLSIFEKTFYNCTHRIRSFVTGGGLKPANYSANSSSNVTRNLSYTCESFEKETEKKDVIKEWDKLIEVLYDYLQVVRSRGGTMGHKVGYFYEKQKSLRDTFKNHL